MISGCSASTIFNASGPEDAVKTLKRSSIASAMDSRTPLSSSTTKTLRSFAVTHFLDSVVACAVMYLLLDFRLDFRLKFSPDFSPDFKLKRLLMTRPSSRHQDCIDVNSA